jgi:Xaa-Pro aminopeptidase
MKDFSRVKGSYMYTIPVEKIQTLLEQEHVGGWLFYDFRRSNLLAHTILQIPAHMLFTRRWFYFVPQHGESVKVVSAVEQHVLDFLPGKKMIFRTWQEFTMTLTDIVSKTMPIAMEYSRNNAIPYISGVDAGTVELVRACGGDVISSADISQYFLAQLSIEQIASHRKAATALIHSKDRLCALLHEKLQQKEYLNEYVVQQWFIALMQEEGVQVDEPPLIAVNANASNPHYCPTIEQHSPINPGDILLLDFWARALEESAIYADYTWMTFAGTREAIPAKEREIFTLVRDARNTGIDFVRKKVQQGERVRGCEVDDIVRAYIHDAGYGDYFVHRTGHSITTSEHGEGANLDNLETHDERKLLPHTICSVEPGIYLAEFGVRSEVNMLILEHDIEITGVPMQEEIIPLL